MQQKSSEKFSLAERLKRLKNTRQCTWSQLAIALDVSDQTIYNVRSGKKGLGDNAEYRLRELERESGLLDAGQDDTEMGHKGMGLREDRPGYSAETPASGPYAEFFGELLRLRERFDEVQRQMTAVDAAAQRLRPMVSSSGDHPHPLAKEVIESAFPKSS